MNIVQLRADIYRYQYFSEWPDVDRLGVDIVD